MHPVAHPKEITLDVSPAPFHISSRRGQHDVVRGLLCFACIMATIWLTVFVSVCVLLYRTNTPQVHISCPGFWDFMLVSVLSPMLLPLLYLMSSSVLTLSWASFSTAWLLVMSLLSFIIVITATLNVQCVESLREITSPFPWLLFVGWIKSVMYFAGLVSALRGLTRH
jgi:hypothetical protein